MPHRRKTAAATSAAAMCTRSNPPHPSDRSPTKTSPFLPVTELSALVRTRKVSSVELTKLYLARLKRFDDLLKCVVTLTEDLALKQAERADREIAAGRYRGPLHGIPWGAKDLIAWPGYKTTWGAGVFQEQTLDVQSDRRRAGSKTPAPCSSPSSRSARWPWATSGSAA